MSNNILHDYRLMFEYTLVPIGSRYWIVNAKSGSRYVTKFKNENDNIKKVKISICRDNEVESPGNIIFEFSGIKFKINVFLEDERELDTQLTLEQFKSMMDRTSVWVIRNPYERFKSGVIQKIRHFYMEMQEAYLDKTKDWKRTFFIPNHAFHQDYPLEWPIFFESYSDLRIDEKSKSVSWFSIWKQFCEYFFLDICRYNDISDSFLGDVHTQPYLYQLNLFFKEIGILDKLTILDITELNSNDNLFITEMGKVQYEKRKQTLIKKYTYDDSGNKRNVSEFESHINESNGNLKDINYKSLEKYFQKSDVYRWEMFVYILLLKGNVPNKKIF
jgi:hypothetical protein